MEAGLGTVGPRNDRVWPETGVWTQQATQPRSPSIFVPSAPMLELATAATTAWTIVSGAASGRRATVSSPSELWLLELVPTIGHLLELPQNWDSYGAKPIKVDFIRYALEILTVIACPNLPAPALVPTARGGVQIEWHMRGIDLEIRVESTSRIHVSFEDHQGVVAEWEGDLTSDLTRLDEFVSALSRRG